MRTFSEIERDARDVHPFANGFEGYGWMASNCDRCIHDRSARDDTVKPDPANGGLVGCPVIGTALLGKTPLEFLDGPRDENGSYGIDDQYHCIEFRDESDGPDPEPQPLPDPEGMDELIPREQFTGALMFTANVPQLTASVRAGDD